MNTLRRLLASSLCATLFLGLHPRSAFAQSLALRRAALVDHPVISPWSTKTPYAWRQGVGGFGESLTDCALRLRGYQTYEIKQGGGQGFDRIAIKRGAGGELQDVRFVEVKTGQARAPRLGEMLSGRQMSRRWLADRLRAMRRTNDAQIRSLAMEVARFRKRSGVSIENMAEVWNFTMSTGRYRIVRPNSTEIGEGSTIRLLRDTQRRGTLPATRNWATRHLAEFDQIQAGNMSRCLREHSTMGPAVRRVIARTASIRSVRGLPAGASLASKSRFGLARPGARALKPALRVLGPITIIAEEGFLLYQRHSGKMNSREFWTAQGGLAGATAGATAGAVIGGSAGAVPGAVIGAAVGGYVGDRTGEWAAGRHYDFRDEDQARRFEEFVYDHYGVAPTRGAGRRSMPILHSRDRPRIAEVRERTHPIR